LLSTIMDKLSNLARFKQACPFLGRSSIPALRALSTTVSPRHPALSALTEKAAGCPFMGPALAVRSAQILKAGYASVADVHHPQAVPAAGCPHAAAARGANPATNPDATTETKAAVPEATKEAKPGHFDYDGFYRGELKKKHDDKSYRYFNNINRLAGKFTVAHTADVKDEVDVWCSNDYLGMSKSPVVLNTMQYVGSRCFDLN
jgi:5-aminolevulinate synthase